MNSTSNFETRAPWWGGDLQTLRNQVISSYKPLESESKNLDFLVSDGTDDKLTGILETPMRKSNGPLIVLLHGLTGCAGSAYIRETARYHLLRGRSVLRLNLRGAGSSGATCENYYHSGCAADLHDVLQGIDESINSNGIFIIGFSLGGNILINFLFRFSKQHNLLGAATVSAPISPLQASQRLMAPRNMLYHRWLLRRMQIDILTSRIKLTTQERNVVQKARSVYEFDNNFTAPRNGYKDADDYYSQTAGVNFVPTLSMPVLMIHAENDPWIPVAPYLKLRHKCPPNIDIKITKSGGHVGFHAKCSQIPWYDRYIGSFLEALSDKTGLRDG